MSAAKAPTALVGAPLRAAGPPHEGRLAARPNIGGFELTRLVGCGRWSRVFRARPVGTAENDLGDYAVKLLAPQHAANPIARARLRREAVVCRAAPSRHLLAVLADGTAAEHPHLVFPLVEGATLERACGLPRAKPIPAASALWMARQAAEALAALHAAHWLHGSVSPREVLVAAAGHATLIGCGQARRLGTAECAAGHDAGGDPRYGAPESFTRNGVLTGASDIYSLGVVLYELLAGRPPLAGRNFAELAREHRLQAPPPIRQLRPELSREIAELVQRMLAKEPLRRPGIAEAIRWLTELEIAELGVV
jgi:serine/threonine-protein kinase